MDDRPPLGGLRLRRPTDMRYLLWDFDGTLAVRHEGWSGVFVDLLRKAGVASTVTREDILPHLQSGFPWHTPEEPHTHLSSSDLWWQALHPVCRRAFEAVGVSYEQATSLAAEIRDAYLSPSGWRIFEDTVPALSALRDAGWRHIVLSNHVPELGGLLAALGLDRFFDHVLSSGITGYEKPHPEAFRAALALVPLGAKAWMVGDSYRGDVLGAEAAGLPAVLVRSQNAAARYQCTSLYELEPIIGG